MTNRYSFCLSLLLCLAIIPLAFGQSQTTGAIRGLVHEEGNPQAVIANATITILHIARGISYQVRTNARGEYFFEFVDPGFYRISGEAPGYVQAPGSVVNNFQVPFNVTTVQPPPPIVLRKAGAPAPSGSVPQTTAAPPLPAPAPAQARLVNLEDATRRANFDERMLQSLPFFGPRSFDHLALLAAGVAPSPQAIGSTVGPGVGAGVGTSGQFSVNGLRSRANNFTVDGSDNNDEDIGVRRQGFTALVPQVIESLQGFQIITLLPRSQYGRNLGAQVNAISRAGGQRFHGALYGFFTDRGLKARDAFDLTNGIPDVVRRADGRPVLLKNGESLGQIQLPDAVGGEQAVTRGQYGFTIGGPVTKRKTFFFSSFERQDINATQEANFAVPTVAERGLFRSGETGLLSNRGDRVSPTSVFADSYFSLFPFPNNPRGPYGANSYTEQLPASADGTIFSLKLDQPLTISGRQNLLTGRYNFTDDATTLPVTGEAIFSTLRSKVRTQNLSLFFTSAITPAKLSNEYRFSYGRTRLGFDEVRSPFLTPSRLRGTPFLLNARKLANNSLPGVGETIYELRPDDTEIDTDPIGQVIVSGYSPLGADVFNFPQSRVNNTFQTADTLIYNFARHRLTAGADVRRTQLNSRLDRNSRSAALFTGSADAAPLLSGSPSVAGGFYTGADFVSAGAATGFIQTQSLTPDSTIGLRYWQNNVFFTDQIGPRPNFKLTIGLRYELNTVPREVNGRIESTFDSSDARRFISEERRLFGVSGFERFLAGRDSVFRGDHNNLAPHVAFAWDPFGSGRTAVRAGYGVYFDQIPGAVISQSRSVFPRFLTINLAGVQFTDTLIAFNPARLSKPGTLNIFNTNAGRGNDLLDALLFINQSSNSKPNHFPATPNFTLPAADLVTPYAQHWGLTFERELRRFMLVSLAYVGTKGTRLLRFATPNLGPNAIPVITGGSLTGSQINFIGDVYSPGQGFKRPFPLLGSFTSIESDANSIYHGLQAEASMRLTSGLQLTAAYTWSHTIDEVSDLFDLAGARGLAQNSFDRRAERGDANFDVRHRFVESFIWDLPVWRGSAVLGGWQLAGVITLQTGQPYTVLSSVDVNLDGNLTDRLNTLSGVRRVDRGSTLFEFPSTPAEQFRLLAAAGADGAAGRNTFRAPGLAVVDLTVNKLFRFTDQQQLEWRIEVFNLFNRTHFGIPAHAVLAPGLGRSTRTTIPARTAQFALRYKF